MGGSESLGRFMQAAGGDASGADPRRISTARARCCQSSESVLDPRLPKMEDAHERVKTALRINGLSDEGSLSECIDRLRTAGTQSRKKRGTSELQATMSQIIRDEMKQEITAKLEDLPLETLAGLATELGTDRSAESIASYLCAKPIAELADK